MDESFLELLLQSAKTATDDEIRRVFDAYETELNNRGIKVMGPKRADKPGHNLLIGTNYGQKILPRETNTRRLWNKQRREQEEREVLAAMKHGKKPRLPDVEAPKDVGFTGSRVEVDYSNMERSPDGTLRWDSSWMGPSSAEQHTWNLRVFDAETRGANIGAHTLFVARLHSSHRIDAEYMVGTDLDDDDF